MVLIRLTPDIKFTFPEEVKEFCLLSNVKIKETIDLL